MNVSWTLLDFDAILIVCILVLVLVDLHVAVALVVAGGEHVVVLCREPVPAARRPPRRAATRPRTRGDRVEREPPAVLHAHAVALREVVDFVLLALALDLHELEEASRAHEGVEEERACGRVAHQLSKLDFDSGMALSC